MPVGGGGPIPQMCCNPFKVTAHRSVGQAPLYTLPDPVTEHSTSWNKKRGIHESPHLEKFPC